jgi:hypothetical protein
MKRVGRWIAIVVLSFAVVGLVEAQFHLVGRFFGSRPLGQRELAAEFLARYLADHYPGRTAVILSNPFSKTTGQPEEIYQFEKAGVRGLQRGFGGALKSQVAFPDLKPEAIQKPRSVYIDPTTTTPLSYLLAPDALDKIVQQYPDAEIIVSLIGLPVNVRESGAWKAEKQKFALLLPDLRVVGNQAVVIEAIKARKITAIVLTKPGAPGEDQPLGKDARMEFDRRFLLITPETLDAHLKAYPRLFR